MAALTAFGGGPAQLPADVAVVMPTTLRPTILAAVRSVFESGAMLIYLAEKSGKLLPAEPRGRFAVLEWLMFQMGSIGPMLGQTHHFRLYAPEKLPYAIARYSNEAKRIYGVLDKRLDGREWVASDDYSIADIAIFPWLRSWQNQGIDWADFPHLKRWFDRVAARPAVQRGVEVLASLRKPFRTDAEREVLFGAKQYERH